MIDSARLHSYLAFASSYANLCMKGGDIEGEILLFDWCEEQQPIIICKMHDFILTERKIGSWFPQCTLYVEYRVGGYQPVGTAMLGFSARKRVIEDNSIARPLGFGVLDENAASFSQPAIVFEWHWAWHGLMSWIPAMHIPPKPFYIIWNALPVATYLAAVFFASLLLGVQAPRKTKVLLRTLQELVQRSLQIQMLLYFIPQNSWIDFNIVQPEFRTICATKIYFGSQM